MTRLIIVTGPTGVGKNTYSLSLSKDIDVEPEVHYLSAQKDVRKKRVEKRDTEKDPDVYSFEVTDSMFNFMEPRYEIPGEVELANGRVVNA